METSFRSFAELCVTRQIITAIKTATRFKHAPLNQYVSFSHTPAGQESDSECTLGDALPGPGVDDPAICVISTQELQSLVFCLGTGLSPLEADALRLYLEGDSYETMADKLELRHEDDRQRAAAREAQGADAPAGARSRRPERLARIRPEVGGGHVRADDAPACTARAQAGRATHGCNRG